MAGSDNSIFGEAPFNTSIKNSTILGGYFNLITHNTGLVNVENCVIVGGENNKIKTTVNDDVFDTVILGGKDFVVDTSDTVYCKNINSCGARIRNNKYAEFSTSTYVSFGLADFQIKSEDEQIFIINKVVEPPQSNEWNIDIFNLVFGQSKVGRVVDIIQSVRSFVIVPPTQPLILGTDTSSGNYYINNILNDKFNINNIGTKWVSVRIVVSKIIGNTTYLEVYGTGG